MWKSDILEYLNEHKEGCTISEILSFVTCTHRKTIYNDLVELIKEETIIYDGFSHHLRLG